MTINKAKRIVREFLTSRGLTFTKLTARTAQKCIFVRVSGWMPNCAWGDLDRLATENGFCVED